MISTDKSKKQGGFTLIELLVVISIVSLLSSIVLASVSNARLKAKDAAIKMGVAQFVTLLNLEYDDNQSYTNLQGTWVQSGLRTCDSAFTVGNHQAQARAICNNIYNNSKKYIAGSPVGSDYRINFEAFSGTLPNIIVDNINRYTVMVYLNNGNWYCSGSSGRKGEYPTYWVDGTHPNGYPGCALDP